MRNFVYCALLLCGLTLQAHAEAEKFFSERSKDFGAVTFGQFMVHKFTITNTSNQNVQIDSARVSCGCVSATIAKRFLRPGESTELTTTMDTSRFIGYKQVTVYVSFSAPYREEVSVVVSATRNDRFSKSAEEFSLGKVPYGKEVSSTVIVAVRGEPNFQIIRAGSETDYVNTTAKLVRRDTNEVVYELVSTMKPGLEAGIWTTNTYFVTNSTTTPTFRLPLRVEILSGAPTATPSEISFDVTKVGEEKTLRVLVKGEKPFKITEVRGQADVLKSEYSREPKTTHVVNLTYRPQKAGVLNSRVEVQVDSQAAPIIIPVHGQAE